MDLLNKKWGSLSKEIQDNLLKTANCVDGISGMDCRSSVPDIQPCIVDLITDEIINISTTGYLINDEIIIADNALLYNPEDSARYEENLVFSGKRILESENIQKLLLNSKVLQIIWHDKSVTEGLGKDIYITMVNGYISVAEGLWSEPIYEDMILTIKEI